MAKQKGPLDPFDDAKLAMLSEPIMVTVHKMMNGRPSPITLPVKPGEDVAGKGWTQDEVRQLDDFLSKQWSGGGQYNNTATGSNGEQMRWQSYFPIDRFPEIPAPMTTQSGNGSHAPAPAAPAVSLGGTTQVVPPTPAYAAAPGWMQFASSMLPQPMPSMASTPYPGAQQLYPQFPQGYPQPSSTWLEDPRRAGRDREEERFRQEREARLQLEARMERQQLENAYKEQLAHLSNEIRLMKDSSAARPAGESEEVRLLRAQIDELRRQGEESKTAMMIREIQQSMQQQIAALTQLVQTKGPDPMILMLIETQKASAEAQKETARLQAEAQKETARLQAEAAREAARTALGPREIIELVSKSNQGHDQISGAYTRLLETTQQTYENMMNAQGPQVHPAVEMAANGIQGVLGVAQRYIEAKEVAATTQSRAAAAAAQAQAQAQVAMAAQRGLAGESPDGRAPTNVAPPVTIGGTDEGEDDEEEDDDEIEAAEKELFGGALEAVLRLRKGVELGQLAPEQAALALMQGMDHFSKKGEPVPAFALWQQGELGKLVDVLLPDALASYREQLAGLLFVARQQRGGK